MQKGEEDGKFNENVVRNNKKVKFFNLGPVNKWQKILPDKIQSQMNTYYGEDLKKLGYTK